MAGLHERFDRLDDGDGELQSCSESVGEASKHLPHRGGPHRDLKSGQRSVTGPGQCSTRNEKAQASSAWASRLGILALFVFFTGNRIPASRHP